MVAITDSAAHRAHLTQNWPIPSLPGGTGTTIGQHADPQPEFQI